MPIILPSGSEFKPGTGIDQMCPKCGHQVALHYSDVMDYKVAKRDAFGTILVCQPNMRCTADNGKCECGPHMSIKNWRECAR